MADTSNLSKFLTDVADAIRTKKETTEPIAAEQFDQEILSIETGSGDIPVKLFETEEEMQADETAEEGDLALVYRNESVPMTSSSTFTNVTFPDTVVFDTAITSSSNAYLYDENRSYQTQCRIQLSKTYFRLMDYYTYEYIAEYTSSDGITYTKSSNETSYIFEQPMHFKGTWKDAYGQFIYCGGSVFDGLYNYGEIITEDIYCLPVNSLTLGEDNKFTWDKTYNMDYVVAVDKLQKFIDKCIAYCEENNKPTIGGGTDFAFIYQGKLTTLMYTKISGSSSYTVFGYNVTYDLTTARWWLSSSTVLSYMDTSSVTLLQYDEDNDSVIATPINIVTTVEEGSAYMDIVPETIIGYPGDIKGNGYYIITNNAGESIYSRYDDLNIDSKYHYMGYDIAPSQLTLDNANQLLPGKIAYGKDGIIEGDGSIYNNLDNLQLTSKVLNPICSTSRMFLSSYSGDIGFFTTDYSNKHSIATIENAKFSTANAGYNVYSNSDCSKYYYVKSYTLYVCDTATNEELLKIENTSIGSSLIGTNHTGLIQNGDVVYFIEKSVGLRKLDLNTLEVTTIFALDADTSADYSLLALLSGNKAIFAASYQAASTANVRLYAKIVDLTDDSIISFLDTTVTSSSSTQHCDYITVHIAKDMIYLSLMYHGTSGVIYTRIYGFDRNTNTSKGILFDKKHNPSSLSTDTTNLWAIPYGNGFVGVQNNYIYYFDLVNKTATRLSPMVREATSDVSCSYSSVSYIGSDTMVYENSSGLANVTNAIIDTTNKKITFIITDQMQTIMKYNYNGKIETVNVLGQNLELDADKHEIKAHLLGKRILSPNRARCFSATQVENADDYDYCVIYSAPHIMASPQRYDDTITVEEYDTAIETASEILGEEA